MPTLESTPAEMFAYWGSLIGWDAPEPLDEDGMLMYFQDFRAQPERLPLIFEGAAKGEEILPRVRAVFEVATKGWRQGDRVNAYFTNHHPRALASSTARALCEAHLGAVARIAAAFDDDDDQVRGLLEVLETGPRLDVVHGCEPERTPRPDRGGLDSLIYDVTCDFMSALRFAETAIQSHAHLLHEAFYGMACNYFVASHLEWPLHRHLTNLDEPFAAYFELWKHGASYRFAPDGNVRVYVPNLIA